MNNIQKLTGFAIAAAAAAVFSTVTVGSAFAAAEAKVQCAGVNACKGQNDCAGAKNACKGQGSCKGTGFKEMSKADCDKAKAAMKKS
jgi:hypothetical protein